MMGCGGSKSEPGPEPPDQDKRPQSPEGARRGDGNKDRRQAFSSGAALKGATDSLESAHAYPEARSKTDAELERLTVCTADMMIFSSMEVSQKREIFDAMFELVCELDDLVIRQGEIGDVLYVVEEGTFEAYLRVKGDEV